MKQVTIKSAEWKGACLKSTDEKLPVHYRDHSQIHSFLGKKIWKSHEILLLMVSPTSKAATE